MTLATVAHRKVRAVMRDNSQATEALCIVAMRGQTTWTLAAWLLVLADLDKCNHKVSDWLLLNDDVSPVTQTTLEI